MGRPFYILGRLLEMFGSLFSRFINAAFLGGSTHQTTSSRAHIETSKGWRRARVAINAAFFWQADHCRMSWETEVSNARKTLDRNGMMQ
jgi:hypothetical protein